MYIKLGHKTRSLHRSQRLPGHFKEGLSYVHCRNIFAKSGCSSTC